MYYWIEAKIYTGASASAALKLPTGPDTKGYLMLGGSASIMAAIGCSFGLFHGINEGENKQKVVVSTPNLVMTIVMQYR